MKIQECKLHKLYLKRERKIIYNKRLSKKGAGYIQALENGYLTQKQTESLRKLLIWSQGRSFFLWPRLSFIFGKSQKPKESRMGKGKGNVFLYVAQVKKGDVIFIFENQKNFDAKLVRSIKAKLPLKVNVNYNQ